MKEKAIIFDFFGVVSSRVSVPWLEKNFRKDDVPEVHKIYVRAAYEGKISEEELFSQLEKLTGRKAEVIREEWVALSRIDNKIIDLIRELKSRYLIVLCTDAFVPFVRELLDQDDIRSLFDKVVISSEIKMGKPGLGIYEYTLQQLGILPQNAVFIDDQEKNVRGAEDAGMKSILYSGVVQLRENLAKLGFP